MKSKILWRAALCSLLALVLMFAACGNPAGGNGGLGGEGGEEGDLTGTTISGKFINDGKTNYFIAKEDTVARFARSIFRAAGDNTQVPLTGTLDDGDMTFRLKGFYDSETGAYTLSATSSLIKFGIKGNTEVEGSTMASISTSNDGGKTFSEPIIVRVNVDLAEGEAVSNVDTDKAVQTAVDGVPAEFQGTWKYQAPVMSGGSSDMPSDGGMGGGTDIPDMGEIETQEQIIIINDWSLSAAYQNDNGEWENGMDTDFLSVDRKTDGSVDVVWAINSYDYSSEPMSSEEYEEMQNTYAAQLETEGYIVLPQSAISEGYSYSGIFLPSGPNFPTVGILMDEYLDTKNNLMYPASMLVEDRYIVSFSYRNDTNGLEDPNAKYAFHIEDTKVADTYWNDESYTTFAAAIAGAESVLENETGYLVDIVPDPKYKHLYTEVAIQTRLQGGKELAQWLTANPAPTPLEPADFWDWTQAKQEEWRVKNEAALNAYYKKYDDYRNKFMDKAKELLVKYFPSNYPNKDKIIFRNENKFYNGAWALWDEQNPPQVTTMYQKMNAKLSDGDLLINVYVDLADTENSTSKATFDEAYALTTLAPESMGVMTLTR